MHFFHSVRLSHWRVTGFAFHPTPPFAKIFDFVQNGSSWRVKSAILKIPSGSLILNFAFETLKRFQSLRQSFALAHFVRFHLTSVLRNFAILSLICFLFIIFCFVHFSFLFSNAYQRKEKRTKKKRKQGLVNKFSLFF